MQTDIAVVLGLVQPKEVVKEGVCGELTVDGVVHLALCTVHAHEIGSGDEGESPVIVTLTETQDGVSCIHRYILFQACAQLMEVCGAET